MLLEQMKYEYFSESVGRIKFLGCCQLILLL